MLSADSASTHAKLSSPRLKRFSIMAFMPKFAPEFLAKAFASQVASNHRTLLVVVGHNAKDSIPVLHDRMSRISSINTIVWCYRNSETEGDKNSKKIKLREGDSAMAKWIKVHNPEYISYKESTRILGRTCDMLILEDFEALSPNMIASSVEAVRGGGLIVLLFDQEKPIGDVCKHAESIPGAETGRLVSRFNRRLFKSLLSTDFAIFLDAKLRVMDVTKDVHLSLDAERSGMLGSRDVEEHPLVGLCRTSDQKRVLRNCIDLISKHEPSVTSITASRGRGKSVAMGLSVVEAVVRNFGSIVLSALFLENVQVIFEYALVGLDKMGYKKMADYKVEYTFEKKRRLMSKIEILRGTRQSIEYVHPFDEIRYYPALLVVDEAASIPLTYLKRLLDAKFVFMASTASGYEGTGRVFRTKLSDYISTRPVNYNKFEMREPIRYSAGDPIEEWLNKSLLLDASVLNIQDCPVPSECALFHVNKGALFSGSPRTEEFLSELFSLFIASHYKNSPNDLQVLADSPNHEIFALLTVGKSPRVICAIQVVFEGMCDKNALVREGNLIPWVVYESYSSERFLSSYGARIVRIAVHPHLTSMGYGSAALGLLKTILVERAVDGIGDIDFPENDVLLRAAHKISLPKTCWVGSCFGLTERLLNFWKRSGFFTLCVKQTPSKATGEFSTVVVQPLGEVIVSEVEAMKTAFLARFVMLLGYSFRDLSPSLGLSLIYGQAGIPEKKIHLTDDEVERLGLFSKGLLDTRNVIDALPDVSRYFFYRKCSSRVSVLEQSILLMTGCQHKSMQEIARHFDIEEFKATSLLARTIGMILEDVLCL